MLYQVDLPTAETIDVTYDVVGASQSDSFTRPYIALDDLAVKPGVCPTYSKSKKFLTTLEFNIYTYCRLSKNEGIQVAEWVKG